MAEERNPNRETQKINLEDAMTHEESATERADRLVRETGELRRDTADLSRQAGEYGQQIRVVGEAAQNLRGKLIVLNEAIERYRREHPKKPAAVYPAETPNSQTDPRRITSKIPLPPESYAQEQAAQTGKYGGPIPPKARPILSKTLEARKPVEDRTQRPEERTEEDTDYHNMTKEELEHARRTEPEERNEENTGYLLDRIAANLVAERKERTDLENRTEQSDNSEELKKYQERLNEIALRLGYESAEIDTRASNLRPWLKPGKYRPTNGELELRATVEGLLYDSPIGAQQPTLDERLAKIEELLNREPARENLENRTEQATEKEAYVSPEIEAEIGRIVDSGEEDGGNLTLSDQREMIEGLLGVGRLSNKTIRTPDSEGGSYKLRRGRYTPAEAREEIERVTANGIQYGGNLTLSDQGEMIEDILLRTKGDLTGGEKLKGRPTLKIPRKEDIRPNPLKRTCNRLRKDAERLREAYRGYNEKTGPIPYARGGIRGVLDYVIGNSKKVEERYEKLSLLRRTRRTVKKCKSRPALDVLDAEREKIRAEVRDLGYSAVAAYSIGKASRRAYALGRGTLRLGWKMTRGIAGIIGGSISDVYHQNKAKRKAPERAVNYLAAMQKGPERLAGREAQLKMTGRTAERLDGVYDVQSYGPVVLMGRQKADGYEGRIINPVTGEVKSVKIYKPNSPQTERETELGGGE